MHMEPSLQPTRRRPAPALRRLLAILLTLPAPGVALAQKGLPGLPADAPEPTDGSTLASLSLVAERQALVPDAVNWVGLHFTIHEGWHLYWRNNGDTGAPMQITLEHDDAVHLGEILYPAPHRHPIPGGFVDFIYEDQVTLLLPVTLDPDIATGRSVRIEAKAEWLICKELCLAGSGESSIELTVAHTALPSSHAPLFDAARKRIPAPMADAEAAGIDARWTDARTLSIHAPGARSLTFFPYESPSGAYPEDMAERGKTRGDTITLQYDEKADDADRIAGVLEVRSPHRTAWYEIEMEAPPGAPH